MRSSITARVQHAYKGQWIQISLCSASTCNLVAVKGSTPTGTLRSESWAGCSNLGANCKKRVKQVRNMQK